MRWWDEGACRGDSVHNWYPVAPTWRTATELVRRCLEDCPVQAECLSHALAEPETYGVWGGFTETELFAIRTRRFSRCGVCGRRWPKAKLTPTTTCRWCLIEKLDNETMEATND